MDIPEERQIIAAFDALVAEGVLVHGPHRVIEHDCDGYPMEFRVCPALARKPNTFGAALDPTFDKSRRWGPASDLFMPDQRLVLANLNDTHDLALNLFCVDRPQFLLLTRDSYRRQHVPLDLDDLEAALKLLTTLDSVYVIFNGGEAAGCTRVHKHMQGLLGPPRAFSMFVGDDEARSKIPFLHFTHQFVQGFGALSGSRLLSVYRKLLEQARESLPLPDGGMLPHNVVLWDNWIIVIPRRAAVVGDSASANAAGMMGSLWVSSEEPVDEWLRLGCPHVLRELGFPS